jgi:chorismate mutase
VSEETTDLDPVVEELRAEITALDRGLIAEFNRRLELVKQLHAHKNETGMPIRDLDREIALLRELEQSNAGPLSPEGVAQFHTDVIELTREELYGG